MWIDALAQADLIAPGCRSIAYTYIGPKLTWPIYRDGTIGKAKEDLERAGRAIDARLKSRGGSAHVAVMKAVVTQASSAIPVVPLYISLLFRIMKAKGTHEGCIEQTQRLFERMYAPATLAIDEKGRIRLDDWEMQDDVQREVGRLWPTITTENLNQLTDFKGYQEEFLKLFGFGILRTLRGGVPAPLRPALQGLRVTLRLSRPECDLCRFKCYFSCNEIFTPKRAFMIK
jgi:enoyl-[acyl-carrier protein] reductase/trans-2-enoyl-CoA reductase (NAD+)